MQALQTVQTEMARAQERAQYPSLHTSPSKLLAGLQQVQQKATDLIARLDSTIQDSSAAAGKTLQP